MLSRPLAKVGNFVRTKKTRNGLNTLTLRSPIRKAQNLCIKSSAKTSFINAVSQWHHVVADRVVNEEEIRYRRSYAKGRFDVVLNKYWNVRIEIKDALQKITCSNVSPADLARLRALKKRMTHDAWQRTVEARKALTSMLYFDPEVRFYTRSALDACWQDPDMQRYRECLQAFAPSARWTPPAKKRIIKKSLIDCSRSSKSALNKAAIKRRLSEAFTGDGLDSTGRKFEHFNLWRSDLTVIKHNDDVFESSFDMPFGCPQNKTPRKPDPLLYTSRDSSSATLLDSSDSFSPSSSIGNASPPSQVNDSIATIDPTALVANNDVNTEPLVSTEDLQPAVEFLEDFVHRVEEPDVKVTIERLIKDCEGADGTLAKPVDHSPPKPAIVFFNPDRETAQEKELRDRVDDYLEDFPLLTEELVVSMLAGRNPVDLFTADSIGEAQAKYMLSNPDGELMYSNAHVDDLLAYEDLHMANINLPASFQLDPVDLTDIIRRTVAKERLLLTFQRSFTEYTASRQGAEREEWRGRFQTALADAGYVFGTRDRTGLRALNEWAIKYEHIARAQGDTFWDFFLTSLLIVLKIRYPYTTKYGHYSSWDTVPPRNYEYGTQKGLEVIKGNEQSKSACCIDLLTLVFRLTTETRKCEGLSSLELRRNDSLLRTDAKHLDIAFQHEAARVGREPMSTNNSLLCSSSITANFYGFMTLFQPSPALKSHNATGKISHSSLPLG